MGFFVHIIWLFKARIRAKQMDFLAEERQHSSDGEREDYDVRKKDRKRRGRKRKKETDWRGGEEELVEDNTTYDAVGLEEVAKRKRRNRNQKGEEEEGKGRRRRRERQRPTGEGQSPDPNPQYNTRQGRTSGGGTRTGRTTTFGRRSAGKV